MSIVHGEDPRRRSLDKRAALHLASRYRFSASQVRRKVDKREVGNQAAHKFGLLALMGILLLTLSAGAASGVLPDALGLKADPLPYTITKERDAARVPVGQPIGFTIHLVNNTGSPNVMYIEDLLPSRAGVLWNA